MESKMKRIMLLTMLQTQVTNNSKDTPVVGMISYFSSSYSNPKILKSKLKLVGDVVKETNKKSTEKVLIYNQQVLSDKKESA